MTPNVQTLFDIFTKLGIFLQRPEVQVQLLVFAAVLAVASLVARFSEQWIDKWEPQWLKDRFSSGEALYLNLGITIVSVMVFLILTIAGLAIARLALEANGFAAGLLDKIAQIFWLLVLYRVVITLLYFFFKTDVVGKYHSRLLRPAITIAVFLLILSNLSSLLELASVAIPTPFDINISFGALMASTLGLYFWITLIGALSEISYNVVTRRKGVDAGSVQATLTIIRYIAIGVGLFLILRQLPLDSTAVAAIIGGLSVGIGFGLQEVLSNFISGVLLLFERSLHPGDIIEMDEQMCVVEDLSIRATRVRLPNNVIKIIPNQTFFTSSFSNYDPATVVWFSIPITASYDDEPDEVIALLLSIMNSHPEISKNPGPGCSLANFGDYAIEYTAFFALQNPMRFYPVRNELHKQIWRAFQEQGIVMPGPQQEIFVHTAPPVTPKKPRPVSDTPRPKLDEGNLDAVATEPASPSADGME
jgi:potassium-dependent mechanosensitive channel